MLAQFTRCVPGWFKPSWSGLTGTGGKVLRECPCTGTLNRSIKWGLKPPLFPLSETVQPSSFPLPLHLLHTFSYPLLSPSKSSHSPRSDRSWGKKPQETSSQLLRGKRIHLLLLSRSFDDCLFACVINAIFMLLFQCSFMLQDHVDTDFMILGGV